MSRNSYSINTPRSVKMPSPFSSKRYPGSAKTPASILKKRSLVEKHIKLTPKSKKRIQFSFNQKDDLLSQRNDQSKSDSRLAENSDISELLKFREENLDLCYSRANRKQKSFADNDNLTTMRKRIPSAPGREKSPSRVLADTELTQHACIHNYRVNERLFAEPTLMNDQGHSMCPICQKPEPVNPSDRSPHFVRVSIPKGLIKSPIRVRPHRKKSFDPSDSFALSKHCMAGFVPPKNALGKATIPSQKNLDLYSSAFGTKCHSTVTTRDLQKLALRDKQIAEQRSLSLSKRVAFNQSLNATLKSTKFSKTTKKPFL